MSRQAMLLLLVQTTNNAGWGTRPTTRQGPFAGAAATTLRSNGNDVIFGKTAKTPQARQQRRHLGGNSDDIL
jgi:hypothetical protein